MEKKDTLLHFLTQRSNPRATSEFQRVIADLSSSQKKGLISDILETIRETEKGTEGIKRSPFKNFFKKILNPASKEGKDLEKILDMSPTDLENLMKVMDSPSNAELLKKLDPESQKLIRKEVAEKGSLISVKYILSSNMLVDPMAPTEIEAAVKKFLNLKKDKKELEKHPALIEDFKAKYNPMTYELSFEGPKEVFNYLVEKLKIKPSSLEFLEKGKPVNFSDFEQKIKLISSGDESYLEQPQSDRWVLEHIERFKKEYPDSIKSITYSRDILDYKAPKELLPELLNLLHVKKSIQNSILNKSEENVDDWQLRFRAYSNKPALTSWTEKEISPTEAPIGLDVNLVAEDKAKKEWLNLTQKIESLISKHPEIKWVHLSGDEIYPDMVLSIPKATTTQVSNVLKELFDKQKADVVFKEFMDKKDEFRVVSNG